jgi:hypothetical protein
MRYLGYVPVSPDGALFDYDPKTDEVSNRRHGSPARPVYLSPDLVNPQAVVKWPAPSLAGSRTESKAASPTGQLLDQFRTLRVDVHFREDGLHTVLTLEQNERKR